MMQSLTRRLLQKIINKKANGCRTYCSTKIFDAGQPTAASHPELLKEGEMTPGITCDEYISRRKRLLELLPEKSIAIVAAAPVKMMTDVVPYPYRQDADYLYITGCQQPGGIAVLGHDIGLCMFMPEPTLHDVTWEGNTAGVNEALEIFKADKAMPISKLHQMLSDILGRSSEVFHNVKTATRTYVDSESFQKTYNEDKVKDLSKYTHELRWLKSPAEVELMKKAASIACQAQLQTVFHSKTYPHEGMMAAKVEYECKMRGAQRMAFNPVVGGGPNGSVVHYSRNDRKVNYGELVLMDIGCEFHGYVSDMTRTWPPFGRFLPAHVELYDLILETNKECIKLCKPGISIRQIHEQSVQRLYKGLIEIGVLKNRASSYRTYHQLNPTNIGHYLGMDVHDCSTISTDRPLQPGAVITIEPGVYIPSSFNVPESIGPLKKLRILCLHGFRQNASSFKGRTASLAKKLKSFAEFVFVNAPHELPFIYQPRKLEKECISSPPHHDSPPTKNFSKKYAWLVAHDFHKKEATHWERTEMPFDPLQYQQQTEGFAVSLSYLKSVVTKEGPFDGILGFSQGAAMVALMCAEGGRLDLELGFRFVILCSGFAVNLAGYDKGSITCPSLHVFGNEDGGDRQISSCFSRELSSYFEDGCRMIIEHDSGHIIPTRPPYIDEVKEFLRRFI